MTPAPRRASSEVERVTASTTIDAPREAVFAVLADPSAHADIDGTGWVRASVDAERISAAGQVFRMAMHHERHPDKDYRTANRVEVSDEPRAIAWQTGTESPETGELSFGGWIWRYDLEATGPSRTTVTLTYDWSAVPAHVREYLCFPPVAQPQTPTREGTHVSGPCPQLRDLPRRVRHRRRHHVRGPDNAFAVRHGVGVGAEIMGRGKFTAQTGPWTDIGAETEWSGLWGPNPPFHTPVFVLTHYARPSIEMEGGTVFHFVDASPAEALDLARTAAGDLDVRVGGGPTVVRDFLAAGLIDALHIVQVPVVLGRGVRLWDGFERVEARYDIEAIASPSGVTHLTLTRG